MNATPLRLLAYGLFAVLISGCVSQKKYNELLDSKARADRDNLRLEQVEQDCAQTVQQLSETLNSLDNTEKILTDYKTNLENLTAEQEQLQAEYDQLLEDYKDFQDQAADEKNEMIAVLTLKQSELDDKERLLRGMEATLYANEDKLRDRDQQLREMDARILREQERMDSIKNAISTALLDLSSEDLAVEQRGGKIYVSISQELLFEKNSKTIDPRGEEALAKLAPVLIESVDTDITVEGHTDTDGTESYNWDLSVSRATAVVRQLISNGLPGSRVTASGRAFFDPIDLGTSEDAKSRNRRTEIILTPRLSDIIEFLQAGQESAGDSTGVMRD